MSHTPSTLHPSTYDVLIAGAGPVGLFLACELALAKCSVLVLEKADDPHSSLKRLPFGMRGLSTPTVEALSRRGLLQEFALHTRMKNPHAGQALQARRQMGHFGGIAFYEDRIDRSAWRYRLPGSSETSLLSEMEEVEEVLARRAESLGVEIERGTGATGYQQTADGVTVASGERTFEGRWLVGCDGSRSVVRKGGGFEFAGTEPEFTGYSLQVELADPEKLSLGRTLTATGMYFQSQPGYLVMLEFDGGAGHRSVPVTLEDVQSVLRRVSGTDVTIGALHAGATWTDRARQATRYRDGRVLLAGDAAHIHAPLGGQGLNLGLGDAMNLGWKLAATVRERAPEGLLDSYCAERYPIGERVLDWSRAQVAVMRPGPAARALNAILRDLLDTRDGATYVAGRVWGIATHYDLGGDHPLVGHSVPNFGFEDGSTMDEAMRDGRGILLDFDGRASLEALAGEYGDAVRYVAGRVEERFGLRTLLIRPDGVIAWASEAEADEEAVRRAADPWFARKGSTVKESR